MLAIQFRQTPSPERDFRWACYTTYLMMLIVGLGLAFSAVASARTHHHEATTILLVIFGYTFVAWLVILAGIHAFWPHGWIYSRRNGQKLTQEELGPGRSGPMPDLEGLVAAPEPAQMRS